MIPRNPPPEMTGIPPGTGPPAPNLPAVGGPPATGAAGGQQAVLGMPAAGPLWNDLHPVIAVSPPKPAPYRVPYTTSPPASGRVSLFQLLV